MADTVKAAHLSADRSHWQPKYIFFKLQNNISIISSTVEPSSKMYFTYTKDFTLQGQLNTAKRDCRNIMLDISDMQ